MPPLSNLLALLAAEAAVIVLAFFSGRRAPFAVSRRRVTCPIAARPATIHVTAALEGRAPETLIACSLLEQGDLSSCERACLRPIGRAQPLRSMRLLPQGVRAPWPEGG